MNLIVFLLPYRVLGQQDGNHVTFRNNFNSQDRVTRDLEFIHALAEKAKTQKNLTIPERSGLRTTIGRMVEPEILGLSAVQRQALVTRTIGSSDYSALVQSLMTQLDSTNVSDQRGAIRLLGQTLFSLESSDLIKNFVFNPDRTTQFAALKSLVCLDEPGANKLLENMIFSGVVSDDYMVSTAIDALYVSNDQNLERVAIALLQRQPGGVTFKALLPVLKERDDYRDIVAQIFKSDMFYVPATKDLTMEQKSKVSADYQLLDAIFNDLAYFMADEEIKNKVDRYATGQHALSSSMALIILEKSGRELGN